MDKLASLVIIFLQCYTLFGQTSEKPNPIAPFEPFIGSWVAPDTAAVYKMSPEMKGKIFFAFNRGPYNGFLQVLESFSLTAKGDTTFVGILCPNPANGNFEFTGMNARDGFYFRGQFEDVSAKGFTRHYEVFYPKEHPLAKSAGQIIAFKEKFELVDANTMMFDLKFYSKKDRIWKDWAPGKFTLVRKQ